MNPGDLSSGAGQLQEALKLLNLRWQETADHWRDDKRRQFEEDHLAAIEPMVTQTLQRLARLAQLFQQARQECSE